MTEIAAEWTVNDTARPLSGRLLSDGVPITLDGIASAAAHILRPDMSVLNNAATVDLGTNTWTAEWQTGDLSMRGQYAVEVEVTWSTGKVETFAPDYFKVRDQFA